MACTYASDAYLISHFPAVVSYSAEVWLVTVLAAQAGTYTVTLAGVPYAYEAAADDAPADVQAGLAAVLAGALAVAVSPVGDNALTLIGATPGALAVNVTGPAADTLAASLASGGDTGVAFRAVWLERAKCGLPPCACFTCPGDFTLAHAALAAHHIFQMQGLGAGGASAGAWSSMRLGPASITRGASAWTNPADRDLASTGPGALFLSIRDRYVFGAVCV